MCPVSYTHLDVYKRQFKKRVNLRLDLGFGKHQTGFIFNINEAFQEYKELVGESGTFVLSVPLHLDSTQPCALFDRAFTVDGKGVDVYKRQVSYSLLA